MHRLIVNADDLGYSNARSHGIFIAMEQGIVRSASLIANMSASDSAARRARERNVACGLHLNLSEGWPLTNARDIETLMGLDGTFHPPQKLVQQLESGAIDPEHLEREIRSQFEWMLDTYGQPSHLDSHHVIHLEPLILSILFPILERYGVERVRLPIESLPPPGYVLEEEELATIRARNERRERARPMLAAHSIRTTDHFRGSTLRHRASKKNLRHILMKLPEGTTELMVHPGAQAENGDPFEMDSQRQTELAMLTDASLPSLLAERGIELGTWFEV